MDPQSFRDQQMRYDWWQKHGGDPNNNGGCGCFLLLLLIGVPVVLMLMSGCSLRLQEKQPDLVVSINLPDQTTLLQN